MMRTGHWTSRAALAGLLLAWLSSPAAAQPEPEPEVDAEPSAEAPPPPPGAAPPVDAPGGPQPAPYAPGPAPGPVYGPGAGASVAQEPQPRNVSLTLSPIHLIFPVLELTGEVRLTDHFGLAGIFGYGSIEASDGLETHRFKVLEAGGQLSGYVLAPFDSLHFGLELLYVNVSGDNRTGTVSGVGEGVAVGPFVGYKLITSGGFTFVAQGGVQYMAVRAEAKDTAGNTDSAEQKSVIALLNLNIGWSF